MSAIADVINAVGLSQRAAARKAGVGLGTLQRILDGQWPARTPHVTRDSLAAVLRDAGATPAQLLALYAPPENKLASVCSQHTEAVPAAPETQPETTEEPMLLQYTALSPEAKKHFGLLRSPFVDDVQSADDVYQTPAVRYVRAALVDAARHHGFMAVVGESGSGKSTLAEDLEERIRTEGQPIQIIRPFVLAMEANDSKGKTLKSSQIAEAIAATLAPSTTLKSSPDARFRQLQELLRSSARAGQRHLILIEEAHCMPRPTLKHLKRFLELKDGLKRLVGVALIGQPELRDLLASMDAEIREVAQRCEVVELPPLDGDLEGYLRHKLARMNVPFEKVLAPDAVDAIRARLTYMPRGGKPADARSICYPLVVNNLVCRAMNAAAKVCWPQVDAQVVSGC